MRTTIDLPDELHRIVQSLASHTRRSLSQTAAELMRRGLGMPTNEARSPSFVTDPVTQLPVVLFDRRVTPEDVKALDDDS